MTTTPGERYAVRVSRLPIMLVVAGWVLLAPPPAEATRARSASLMGHPFFPDDSDALVFPAAAPRSSGLVVVSQGDAVGPFGEAGVLVGGGPVFGAYVGVPDVAPALALRADVFPGLAVPSPDGIADVLVAFQPAPGHTLGLRTGLAYALERKTNVEAGDNGILAAGYGAVLGHSWDGDGGDLADTSLRVDVETFRRTERFEVIAEAPIGVGWEFRHRSLWTLAPRVQLGASARLRYDPLDVDVPAANRSAEGAAWAMSAEMGPRIRATDRVTVAVSAMVASESWSLARLDSPPRREGFGSEGTLRLPGVRAAIEARPAEWLDVRMGFQGAYLMREAADGAGNEAVVMGREIAWSSGVGFRWEGLRLDGRLQATLLREGPDAVGGKAPGLFTTVSASYAF